MNSPWPRSWVLRVVCALWSLPVALLGVVVASLLWPISWWTFNVRAGAVDLVARGPFGAWMDRRNWGAMTLGWVIMYWRQVDADDVRIRTHERRHCAQCFAWGPVALLAYPLGLLAFGYSDHPMEVDARAHEDNQ